MRSQVTLNVKGTDPQLKFWNSPKRYRAFVGGVGSGKTFAGCVEVLRQKENTRGAVVAPTFRMLQDATIQTFLEMVRKAGLLREFYKSDMRMELFNGTEILFRSADDPEKLRGPNLGWFWLDEAAMMPELVFDLMMGRLRLPPGRGWVTTTPKGMNWLPKLFAGELRDYDLIQCSSKSNIFLPDHFISGLRERYKGQFLDQEVEGQFVEWVDSPAYTSYSKEKNVKRGVREEYIEAVPLYLACDFNARAMIWPVVQVIGDQPRVLTEISMLGKTSIKKMVKKFRLEFPAHPAGIDIYGDASGGTLSAHTGKTAYDMMLEAFENYPSEVSIMVPKKNPKIVNRLNAMNNILDGTAAWKPLQLDLDETPLLQRDLSSVELDESGRDVKKITDIKDDRHTLTHASDALGYWASMDAPFAEMKSEMAKNNSADPQKPLIVEYDGLAVGGF